jgi:predicted transcriptional regulator
MTAPRENVHPAMQARSLRCKLLYATLGTMSKVNVTVRLEEECVAYLDELSQIDDRDRSYLIKEAIESYLRQRRWQIEEVRKAVAEADAGDFASDEEVRSLLGSLTR